MELATGVAKRAWKDKHEKLQAEFEEVVDTIKTEMPKSTEFPDSTVVADFGGSIFNQKINKVFESLLSKQIEITKFYKIYCVQVWWDEVEKELTRKSDAALKQTIREAKEEILDMMEHQCDISSSLGLIFGAKYVKRLTRRNEKLSPSEIRNECEGILTGV